MAQSPTSKARLYLTEAIYREEMVYNPGNTPVDHSVETDRHPDVHQLPCDQPRQEHRASEYTDVLMNISGDILGLDNIVTVTEKHNIFIAGGQNSC